MLSLTALLRARAAPTAAALAAGRAPCAAGLLSTRCRSSAAAAAPAADDEVFPGASVDLAQPPMHESGSHDAFFLYVQCSWWWWWWMRVGNPAGGVGAAGC